MSCPYTSQQNGKAERILRTINNIIGSLLFQATFPPPIGWRPFTLPPTFSIATPRPLFCSPHPTMPSLGAHPPMTTFESLGVNVIPTSLQPLHTNLLLIPPCVSFLAIRPTTKATVVLTLPPTRSSSLAMLCSMNPPSLLLRMLLLLLQLGPMVLLHATRAP
ncbi:hypothetical protein U9M48_034694 [Paspalum notatum var. saurae]|uniref:Integrase catalytic domain-containing protein n=1 Tax=Paspalum notatum var. saurae TaxID=547442 RepID=A0AAQ3X786_PASNO